MALKQNIQLCRKTIIQQKNSFVKTFFKNKSKRPPPYTLSGVRGCLGAKHLCNSIPPLVAPRPPQRTCSTQNPTPHICLRGCRGAWAPSTSAILSRPTLHYAPATHLPTYNPTPYTPSRVRGCLGAKHPRFFPLYSCTRIQFVIK